MYWRGASGVRTPTASMAATKSAAAPSAIGVSGFIHLDHRADAGRPGPC